MAGGASHTMKHIITAVIIIIATFAAAETVTLTSTDGKTIQAELLSTTDSSVKLKLPIGQTYDVPLTKLDDASQKIVKAKAPRAAVQAVKVKGISSGGRSEVPTWVTDYGSYNKVGVTGRQLYLTISSLSSGAAIEGTIQVLWVLVDQTSNKRTLMTGSSTKIECGLGKDGHFIDGMTLSDTDDKYVALGFQDKTGLRYRGWVARVVDGQGRLMGATSSLPELDKLASEEWPAKASAAAAP
jgi:hypothetical protein